MLAQLLVPATLLLSLLAASDAYAQTNSNGTAFPEGQKPAEEKQGGEYSGFEETGEQTEGLPGKEANPTPQAPISNLDVQQQNQTTTTETAAVATENSASDTSGSMLLAGVGAMAAVAIVAAAWYFRKRGRSS